MRFDRGEAVRLHASTVSFKIPLAERFELGRLRGSYRQLRLRNTAVVQQKRFDADALVARMPRCTLLSGSNVRTMSGCKYRLNVAKTLYRARKRTNGYLPQVLVFLRLTGRAVGLFATLVVISPSTWRVCQFRHSG